MPTSTAPCRADASYAPARLVGGSASDVDRTKPPAFGFLLIGGAVAGAQVRDVRLANELARRGYPVHVWWAMDRPNQSPLKHGITERWLFNAGRYGGLLKLGPADDHIGRWISRFSHDTSRQWILQTFPSFLHRQLCELLRRVCTGVDHDKRLIRHFARELAELGVTHLLPTLECLAPFATAARRQMPPQQVRCLLTFQGYELFATYAEQVGLEQKFYERIIEAVQQSDWLPVTVSDAYAERICSEIGLPRESLKMIPPGIPTGETIDATRAATIVKDAFPNYHSDVPLVSFVGRRDAEKGLDLLLYAARILRARGVELQLAICGPTSFGNNYLSACRQIAWNLRVPVLWSDFVTDEVRSAIFRVSRTVVYPSIHEEPFGMVPVEAMVQRTPVVVPDTGGVAGLIRVGSHQAGLSFRSWDSGDLALQIERLLTDAALNARLSADTSAVADHFSVERLGERLLDHVGLPHYFAEVDPMSSHHNAPAMPATANRAA
jgi:glycosyltransferase involved in cell wall biosynthesis